MEKDQVTSPLAARTRLRALTETELLDTMPEESFDRYTRLAARLLSVPVSLVSLVDADRQFFKSTCGLPEPWATERETPLSHSFCQHVVARNEPLVITDAREHPLVKDNLAIRDLDVIAYLGVPILSPSEEPLGSFCAISGTPRRWSADEVALMRDLAAAVESEIALRVRVRQLAQKEVALKRSRENLRAAKLEAEAASRAKSTFLANMSHELRTPLNAVIGYSELLLDAAEREQREQAAADLSRILAAGRQLLAVVNDVLDLSKIEAGRMELRPTAFEVRPLVEEVGDLVAPSFRKNGNAFVVNCPADVGTMFTDPAKLRQSLSNLLSNAAKYTREGTVTLDVQRTHGDGTDWVTFRVSDTGVGMTAAEKRRLFRAFERPVQADEVRGTGLGLVITENMCTLMKGVITVDSEKGVGSVFTLRLPADVRAAPERREATSPDGTELDVMSARTVLVVDDDPDVRSLLTRHLSRNGFRVKTAATGSAALYLAKKLRPFAITLDVKMPDMDGWQIITELKETPETAAIPIIMLSVVEDSARAYDLGAADFLVKPIDRLRLLEVLRRHRRHHESYHLLLVEDDADIRRVIRRTAETEGYHVFEARDGAEALDLVQRIRPSLILLDLLMPNVDGFECLERLRERIDLEHVPVIVITAKDLTPEERDRLNGVVHDVLEKRSVTRDDLLATVSGWLSRIKAAPESSSPSHAAATDTTRQG